MAGDTDDFTSFLFASVSALTSVLMSFFMADFLLGESFFPTVSLTISSFSGEIPLLAVFSVFIILEGVAGVSSSLDFLFFGFTTDFLAARKTS